MTGFAAKTSTLILLAALASVLVTFGCDRSGDPFTRTAKDTQRDTARARALNAEGAQLIERGDVKAAAPLLEEATKADPFFGPAHNNLGMVHFARAEYYEAAWQFQYAAKLMPGQSEPLVNLGLVYEEVGRNDRARHYYEKALQADPDSLQATGNLARVLVRTGTDEDEKQKLKTLLTTILLRDRREPWRTWAQDTLNRLPKENDDETPDMPIIE